MNKLARLGSTFALASTVLAGCSTMSAPTLKDDACIIGHEVKSELLLAFVFKTSAPEEYSAACREGKTAAQTTYIGQDDKGNLNPAGALFALKYQQIIQDKINSSNVANDTASKKYYQEVNFFFGFFLNKIGGKNINDIQSYVDQLKKVESQQKPKPPARCTVGNGIIRSCPSDADVHSPAVQ